MTDERSKRGLLPTAGAAIAIALVLAVIVFLIARAADDLLVTPPGGDEPEEVNLGAVLFSSVLGGLIGTALAWLTGRFAPKPRITFVSICVVGLVLYGIVPFTAAEETSTAIWLNVMHVAVAVPIVGGLAHYLPESRTVPDGT